MVIDNIFRDNPWNTCKNFALSEDYGFSSNRLSVIKPNLTPK